MEVALGRFGLTGATEREGSMMELSLTTDMQMHRKIRMQAVSKKRKRKKC
jgi:hypothetical protein